MDDGDHLPTVEDVFTQYKNRRSGLVKALTTDVEEFYQKCDNDEEMLGLYGLYNEEWEVKPPEEDVPPVLPDPVLGINFARNETKKEDWLRLVAIHSDTWLLSVSFFLAGNFAFDQADSMINDLPTVLDEVVNAAAKDTIMRESKQFEKLMEVLTPDLDALAEEKEVEQSVQRYMCRVCGESEGPDTRMADRKIWTCCNYCGMCFHDDCVDIEYYHDKCRSCSSEKGLQL